jgi:hypothetical protein
MKWSYTSTPPIRLMAWCSVKTQGQYLNICAGRVEFLTGHCFGTPEILLSQVGFCCMDLVNYCNPKGREYFGRPIMG